MKKILIDDCIRYGAAQECDGSRGYTYLVYPDRLPPEANIDTPEVMAMELAYKPITMPGLRLIEERHYPDGRIEVVQEYNFDPTIFYALFKHWEEVKDSL